MKHRLLISLLFIFPFLVIAFLPSLAQDENWYGVYAYLYHQIGMLLSYPILFLIGFVILTVIVAKAQVTKPHGFHKRYAEAAGKTLLGLLGGIVIAYLILLLVAFAELNIMSVLASAYPTSLGAQTDRGQIAEQLKTQTAPPAIITTKQTPHDILISLAVASTGKYSLYGKSILPSIPSQLVVPLNTSGFSLLLVDNTLIFTEVNQQDMQTIGPLIGYLFVKQYFNQRPIKPPTQVLILTRDQYLEHRNQDAIEKYAEIEKSYQTLAADLENAQQKVLSAQTKKSSNESQIPRDETQRNEEYKKCISAGEYVDGKFQRENTPEECQALRRKWTETISQRKKQIDTAEKEVLAAQTEVSEYEYYLKYLDQLKTVAQVQTGNVGLEFGMYEPPDSIKIVYDDTSATAIADYLATITHEYLHYTSYISADQRFYSSFLEEGLTEFFARRAIQDTLQATTNLSFPVQVKVISEITRRIPEVDLAEIYFTKDETRLRNMLDTIYGEGFYNDTLVKLEEIQYSSNPQEILTRANEIMAEIDGTPLTEKDIVSTVSEY